MSRFRLVVSIAAGLLCLPLALGTADAQLFEFFQRQSPDEEAPRRKAAKKRSSERQAPQPAGPAIVASTRPNEVAAFLGGMEPPADTTGNFARHPAWRQHKGWFDSAWGRLEQARLTKIRAWSDKHIPQKQKTLFYMFSGPDFLYGHAFFPDASTYVLSGLEPVGQLPEINDRTLRALPGLRSSLGSALAYSFFITKNMRTNLQSGTLAGVLPILYAYVARTGKTISEATLITLDGEGNVHPAGPAAPAKGQPGVKIVFAAPGGPPQTLYYFRSDVSDQGVRNSGFLTFAAKFEPGDAFLKSASYLMHYPSFSRVRGFLLAHSRAVVQDDSGIPLANFKREEWQLNPFGAYLPPIPVFEGRFYQPRLNDLYRTGKPPRLDFGVGYRWRGHDSNLLLAVKKDVRAQTP